ncbi:MAG TPA: primosomal protein N', partial [Cobetia sp.]|nr:primosomal protein N' [Cobetia sp.]
RLGRAPRQAELLEMLRQHPQGLTTQVIQAQSFTRDQLKALEAKGLVSCHEETLTGPTPDDSQGLLASPALALNDEQAKALNQLHQGLDRFHPCLLHGVTG